MSAPMNGSAWDRGHLPCQGSVTAARLQRERSPCEPTTRSRQFSDFLVPITRLEGELSDHGRC
jgi:hypothetical protein